MNDVELMDKFIKMFASVAKQHDDFSLAKWNNTIYYYLVRSGVNKIDSQVDLDNTGMFSRWQRYYEKKENCKCFVDKKWNYFCQFVNHKDDVMKSKEHIKVYIPLDYQHIEIGAEAIFDFLSENNIKHISKIGKHIRFDDVVVRLSSEYDARRLQEFINKNNYIQEGLIRANPFADNKDGIAYACDGFLSYNSTVCSAIAKYLEYLKENNQLNNANIEDFTIYWANRYKKCLNIPNQLADMIKDLSGDKYNEFNTKISKNYMQIMELFIDNLLTKEVNYLRQKASVNTLDSKYYIQKIDWLINEYSDIFSFNADAFSQFSKNNKTNVDLKQYIDMALTERYKKYNSDYNSGISNINGETAVSIIISKFIKTGNYNLFTRKNSIRKIMITNISQSDMTKIICDSLEINIINDKLSDEQVQYISSEYSKIISNSEYCKSVVY
ncbi:MAG: hypothetical protein PUD59_05775 [bacterium]|nr:hypothetical protein [bacterium]